LIDRQTIGQPHHLSQVRHRHVVSRTDKKNPQAKIRQSGANPIPKERAERSILPAPCRMDYYGSAEGNPIDRQQVVNQLLIVFGPKKVSGPLGQKRPERNDRVRIYDVHVRTHLVGTVQVNQEVEATKTLIWTGSPSDQGIALQDGRNGSAESDVRNLVDSVDLSDHGRGQNDVSDCACARDGDFHGLL
jgi:hypothetical protein